MEYNIIYIEQDSSYKQLTEECRNSPWLE